MCTFLDFHLFCPWPLAELNISVASSWFLHVPCHVTIRWQSGMVTWQFVYDQQLAPIS